MGCFGSKPAPSNPGLIYAPDSGAIVQLFTELNDSILQFSEDAFRPQPPDSINLPGSDQIRFLSFVNAQFNNSIFLPFHPNISPNESDLYSSTFEGRFNKGGALVL